MHGYLRCAAGALVRSEKVAEVFFHVERGAARAMGACAGAVGEDGSLE